MSLLLLLRSPTTSGTGTVTEDASTPGLTQSATATATTTVVSPAFSPPARSLLFVMVAVGDLSTGYTGTPTIALTTSAGNITFTNLGYAYEQTTDSWNYTAMFVAYLSTAPGSITVTSTRSESDLANTILAVRVLNGAAQVQNGTIVSTNTSSINNIAITPKQAGSELYVISTTSNSVVYTATAGTTTFASGLWQDATHNNTQGLGKSTAVTPSTSPVTLGWTSSASGQFTTVQAAEILPGVAGPVTGTLTGTGTGSSGLTGLRTTSSTLASVGTGTATLTGQDTTTSGLSGAATATSTFGTVPVAMSATLAASGTGSSSLTGTVANYSLFGDATGSSTLTGTQTVGGTLTGSGTGSAALSGSSSITGSLSAGGTASSVLTGLRTGFGTLTAAATGTSSITPVIGWMGTLASAGTASASLSGFGTTSSTLTAAGTGTSSITPVIGWMGTLVAAATGAATLSGFLTDSSTLSAAGTGSATLSGFLSGSAVSLAGTGTGSALLSGGGSFSASLSAVGTATATLTGLRTANGTLAGAATGTAAITPAFTWNGTLVATATATAVLTGFLSGTGTLTGSGTGSALLSGGGSFVGSLSAAGSASSSLTGLRTVAAALTAAGTGTAAITSVTVLRNGTLVAAATGSATLSGTFTQFAVLAGVGTGSSSLTLTVQGPVNDLLRATDAIGATMVSAGVPSDPSTITGLIHRWRAADIALTNGAAVTTWTDSVGGSVLTGANGPTYVTGAAKGQPVVRFNGSTQYFSGTTTAQAQPLSIVIIHKLNALPTPGSFYELIDAGPQIIVGNGANTYDSWAGGTDQFAGTPNTTAYRTYGTAFTGASSSVWLDGTQIVTNGSPGANGVSTSISVGAQSGARFLNGDIAEILLYNRALTATDFQKIDSYSQDTYGVTVADYVATGTAYKSGSGDSAGLTDAVTDVMAASRAPADVVGLTDTVTVVRTSARTVADISGLTDVAGVGRAATAADTLGLTDVGGKVQQFFVADSIGLTDAQAVSGRFMVPLTTTAASDVTTSVGMRDVVRLHAVADVTVDATSAMVKGPQRASVDFAADTSDLTHVTALSARAGLHLDVAPSRLRVVHTMTDILTREFINGVVQNMTVGNGPIYADPTLGPASTGGIETGILGPSGKPVWKLTRNAGVPAGWGSYIAADVANNIPAGQTITISLYVRGPIGEATSLQIVNDPATDLVMNPPPLATYDNTGDAIVGQIIVGSTIIGGPSWQHYNATVTLPKTWVAGTHRLRLSINQWIEWSDATITVSTPMALNNPETQPVAPKPTREPRTFNRVFAVLR